MKRELEIFKDELNVIKNDRIRLFTIKALEKLPDYFWKAPASSTGKHHPNYALGAGGLSRHVKAAVKIAIELFNLEMWSFTDEHKDIILSALFLHDGIKNGLGTSKYTAFDHPLQMASFIQNDRELNSILPREVLAIILNAIATHMGQWNTSTRNKIILPKPDSGIQKFVHMCDYLASRKFLEVNFDKEI